MDSKIWWASKTIMGILALVIVQIAMRFNLKVPDDAVAQITDALLQIAAAIAALWALYGRSKASTTLTLTKPKDDQGSGTPPAAGIALLFATAFMLTACGTVKSDIAALQVTLSAAETSAGAYAALPICGTVATGQPCAQKDILSKIKTADAAAYIAVSAARAAPDQSTLDKAKTAVAALQSIISTVSQ